ncbi:multiple epidermal growth factor-like domains protein 10 [Crassostrea angulata]|uniref:multiple epidermal growth factor-like domains protein 10 n=1 Tax=Magallana angulata TaxID=2784310 RepID=UPI0022B130C1|nr:multiple epidermal growth factor-like domains protein 10 [Crassostrea angulata]
MSGYSSGTMERNMVNRRFSWLLFLRQRGRFAGFSLYVSNTTDRNDGFLCYNNGPELPPLDFNTNCLTYGQYVIFYNERVNGTTYPLGYEINSVFTELCEVTVTGCSSSGVYGKNCEACPYNCQGHRCDIINGTCFICTPGWLGPHCDKACPAGYYGLKCESKCVGHCKDSKTCNHTNGLCNNGCDDGWTGLNCTKECPSKTYGPDCVHNCSGQCLRDVACNITTGKCDTGCDFGYTGEFCETECPFGTYGPDCVHNCSGNCLGAVACNRTTGTCDTGCDFGYTGELCETGCSDGVYGVNCSNKCSKGCTDENCDMNCINGCRSSNEGLKCDENS